MKLSARKVETAGTGRHGDGRGLFLYVKPTGARSWVLRYQVQGRRHDLGLGAYPDVTLAMARQKATDARRLILDGDDPITKRRQAQPKTFKDAALELIESKRVWMEKVAKHAAQWTSTLKAYVFPSLGPMQVTKIATADVVGALKPIWSQKPETANRVRQRIEAVLDYASALGICEGDNPGALAFTILTAARSGETRGMTWAEVDLENCVWTIPAQRMKAGKEHRVPLTPTAIAQLGQRGQDADLIFGSETKAGKLISDMSMTALLRRMDYNDIKSNSWVETLIQVYLSLGRLHKTILQEFYPDHVPQKVYQSIEELQVDLNEWLHHYNN